MKGRGRGFRWKPVAVLPQKIHIFMEARLRQWVLLLYSCQTLIPPPPGHYVDSERSIRINPCFTDNGSDVDDDPEISELLEESAKFAESTSMTSLRAELKNNQVFVAVVNTLIEYEYKRSP